MAQNGVSPWTMGQTSPVLLGALYRITQPNTSGATVLPGGIAVVPLDLTGVSVGLLSLLIYNGAQVKIGTGIGLFTIVQAYPALVQYAWDAADSTTAVGSVAGQYYFKVKVNFNGSSPYYTDFVPWLLTN